jgi:hypothetical protein
MPVRMGFLEAKGASWVISSRSNDSRGLTDRCSLMSSSSLRSIGYYSPRYGPAMPFKVTSFSYCMIFLTCRACVSSWTWSPPLFVSITALATHSRLHPSTFLEPRPPTRPWIVDPCSTSESQNLDRLANLGHS